MSFIDKFCEILSDQLLLHEKLLAIGKEKKQVLIDGTLPELEKIIKQEHELIQKTRFLEKDRHLMITQLAEKLNVGVEKLSVSFLIEAVKEQREKDRLIKLKENLETVIQELSDINQLNSQLLQQSLEYIQTTMEAITEDPDQEMVYSNPSKSSLKKSKSVFDAKS